MEWILEDGNVSKQVKAPEDIVTLVRSMIDGKSEFIILSPSEPVKACNCCSQRVKIVHIAKCVHLMSL